MLTLKQETILVEKILELIRHAIKINTQIKTLFVLTAINLILIAGVIGFLAYQNIELEQVPAPLEYID